MSSAGKRSGSPAVDAFVVMAYDVSDFFVALDVSQDAFTDNWMSLHLTTLVEREWTSFLEQSRRETDFPMSWTSPAR